MAELHRLSKRVGRRSERRDPSAQIRAGYQGRDLSMSRIKHPSQFASQEHRDREGLREIESSRFATAGDQRGAVRRRDRDSTYSLFYLRLACEDFSSRVLS